LILNTD
jgi:hypothetical protein